MKKFLVATIFGFLSFSVIDMSVATSVTPGAPVFRKIKISKNSRESVNINDLVTSVDNYLKRQYNISVDSQRAKIKFLLNPDPSDAELAAIDSSLAKSKGLPKEKDIRKAARSMYGINLVKQVRKFVGECVGGKLSGGVTGDEIEVSDKLLGDIIHLILGDYPFVRSKELRPGDFDIISSNVRNATKAFWRNVVNNALAVTYGDRVGAKKAKLAVTRKVMDDSSDVIKEVKDLLARLSNPATRDDETRIISKRVDHLLKLVNKIDTSGLTSSDGSTGRTKTATDRLKQRLRELCQTLGGLFASGMKNALNDRDALKSLLLQLIAVVSLAQASKNADLLTDLKNDKDRGDRKVTPISLIGYYIDALATSSPDVKVAYDKGNAGAVAPYLVDINYAMLELCISDGFPDVFVPRSEAVDTSDSVFTKEFMDSWKSRMGTELTEQQKKEKFDKFLRCALTMTDFYYLRDNGKLEAFKSVTDDQREEFNEAEAKITLVAEKLNSGDMNGDDDFFDAE